MFSSRKMQSSGWMTMPISCAMRDDGLPAGLGVEGAALAFHEGDAAMAEVIEMAERHAGRDIVIEHDVGDARMSGCERRCRRQGRER